MTNYERQQLIENLIRVIGDDPARPGLKETPLRVLRSYTEMFSGYGTDVGALFKEFEQDHYTGMVVVKDITFTSFCEHHLLPFCGYAHAAYIPAPPHYKVIGLSKIARVVEAYAKRLQLQERLTTDVAVAFRDHMKCLGSACVIEAKHMCMACRGVRKPDATMVTSTLTGEFEKPEVRAEFFTLAGLR